MNVLSAVRAVVSNHKLDWMKNVQLREKFVTAYPADPEKIKHSKLIAQSKSRL